MFSALTKVLGRAPYKTEIALYLLSFVSMGVGFVVIGSACGYGIGYVINKVRKQKGEGPQEA